jgi:hypothetical protein
MIFDNFFKNKRKDMYSRRKKSVGFSEIDIIGDTYSSEDYDRTIIDGLLYRRMKNIISHQEYVREMELLRLYKIHEMRVHRMSLSNTYFK